MESANEHQSFPQFTSCPPKIQDLIYHHISLLTPPRTLYLKLRSRSTKPLSTPSTSSSPQSTPSTPSSPASFKQEDLTHLTFSYNSHPIHPVPTILQISSRSRLLAKEKYTLAFSFQTFTRKENYHSIQPRTLNSGGASLWVDFANDTIAFPDEEWNRYQDEPAVGEREDEVQLTVFEFCEVVENKAELGLIKHLQLGWTGIVTLQYAERPDGSSRKRGRKSWKEQARVLLSAFTGLYILTLALPTEDTRWWFHLIRAERGFMSGIQDIVWGEKHGSIEYVFGKEFTRGE